MSALATHLPRWHHDNQARRAVRINAINRKSPLAGNLPKPNSFPFRVMAGYPPTVTTELNVAAWVRTITSATRQLDFSSGELMRHARAIGGPLLELIGDRDTRELGNVLHEIKGKTFDGFYIDRIGDNRNGAIWRISHAREHV